jgi:hypothetical protein
VAQVGEPPYLYPPVASLCEASIDASHVDFGPITSNHKEMSLYYILFFVMFPFFFVNIFVALIIVTFQEQGDLEKDDELNKNQKSCIEFIMNAQPISRHMPADKDSWRFTLWR